VTITFMLPALIVPVLIAEHSWAKPFVVCFLAISSCVFYGFCYSWPFIGNAMIRLNRSIFGGALAMSPVQPRFLFWFGFVATVGCLTGLFTEDWQSSVVGLAAGLGLLAGSCHFIGLQEVESEQCTPPNRL